MTSEQPHLALTAHPHDRASLLRTDDAWLARQWADPATRVLVVAGTRIRPHDGTITGEAPADAPDGERVLLGEREGVTWFAVLAAAELADTPDWVPLRGLLPLLADGRHDLAPLLVHALGIAEWRWATRFCPRCAGVLDLVAAGHQLRCRDCGRAQFPRLDPAVIMLVADGEPGADDERALLGRSPGWPEGRFSTLAGFCEPGETLEDAVRREVAEEAGVGVGEVTYLGNQPWPLPSSLMLGFHARATTTEIRLEDHELEDARWFTRAQMREETAAGRLLLPDGVSISRSLVELWYGGPLPGRW